MLSFTLRNIQHNLYNQLWLNGILKLKRRNLVISKYYLHYRLSSSFSQKVKENLKQGELFDETDANIGKYLDVFRDDDEKKKKVMLILMEHNIASLEGKQVPSNISAVNMEEMLAIHSFSARMRYMRYLQMKEEAKLEVKKEKEMRRKNYEAHLAEHGPQRPSEHITYGLGNNTTLLRLYRTSYVQYYNQRLANAALHGEAKFIIDMDYDCYMRKQDCVECSNQLVSLYTANRENRYPYDLYFCNVQHSSPTMRSLSKSMCNMYAPDNFITFTDASYLDIFPKDKLMYITHHAKEPLLSYRHDTVYIMAGIIERCVREPVVMAKVKREGIRAAYLPFDDYVMWGRGSKSLPLNKLIEIMLEAKRTNDWNKAFKFVPEWKLVRSLDLFSDF